MYVHTGTHAYRWSRATGSTRTCHPTAGASGALRRGLGGYHGRSSVLLQEGGRARRARGWRRTAAKSCNARARGRQAQRISPARHKMWRVRRSWTHAQWPSQPHARVHTVDTVDENDSLHAPLSARRRRSACVHLRPRIRLLELTHGGGGDPQPVCGGAHRRHRQQLRAPGCRVCPRWA